MKPIVYLTNASAHSGVGYRASKIAEELKKMASGLILEEYLLSGITSSVSRSGNLLWQQRKLPGPLGSKTIFWLQAGLKLRGDLEKNASQNIWHATNQTLSFILSKKAASIVTVHDIIEVLEPQSRAGGIAARYLYSGIPHANHIIAVSQYTATTICEYFNIARERITVIPNSVGEEFYPIPGFKQTPEHSTLLRQLQLPPNARIILYVGSDHPRKNVITAVQAFAKIRSEFSNLYFVKVGEAGLATGRAKLLKEIERLKISKQTRLVGNLPIVVINQLYNAAEIFFYPSRFEGFGLPPLEAMAVGTPVIASNATALAEVVGSAAITHSPDDIDGFCASLRQVLADSTLAATLSDKGKSHARQFSWKKAAEQELAIYQSFV